jgi:hypothetical protein
MPPLLLFTVDVEEDMPGWEITDPITVHNVAALPRLAEMCSELGVLPTYLCTYPTVTNKESAAILRLLYRRGDCEIGTHLHPWNTPPFNGVPGRAGDERKHAYYQYELGPARFRAKLKVLHEAVGHTSGSGPVAFRAGRFGIDAATLRELIPLGYEVDSSVTPLEEHRQDHGPDFRTAPQHPYRPALEDITKPGDLPIVEIPVSVGLTRNVPPFLQRAFVYLPKVAHVRGLLSRDYLNVIDFAWLYPARFDVELMKKAARALMDGGCPVLNVFVHSSELVAGASGRVQTHANVEACFAGIRSILEYCLEEFEAEPCTLSGAARALRPALGLGA